MERKTVVSEWYATICLPKVLAKIRKINKRRKIILHHDNASCHTSAQTTAYLNIENVELMGHPPYSPDLAPNDFFLFPTVKNRMREQRFSTPEEAIDAFKNHIFEIPHTEWIKML